LAYVGEYVRAIHALTLNTLVAPFNETMGVLYFLHPYVKLDLPCFVDNFHPKTKVILDRETFIFALVHSSRISFDGPVGMVYEFL